MRFVIAALLAATFTASAAYADQYVDPNGRILFETPAGWIVGPQRAEGYSYIIAAGPNEECHLAAVPRAETTESPPDLLRTASANQIDPATWTGVARAMSQVIRGDVTIVSQSVNAQAFWPIQRAELTNAAGQRVFGAIQYRPGLELWALCSSYNAATASAASFDAFLNSIGSPNDEVLVIQAQQLAAERTQEELRLAAQRQYNTDRGRPDSTSIGLQQIPAGVMPNSGPHGGN